jgi:uncharacterized protein YegP (UPF0339 family)
MKVDIYCAGDGWRWHVRAKNGRIVAESGEAYTRERDARKAWYRFALLMQTSSTEQ